MEHISEFRGKHYFLSNFYSAPVIYDGVKYLNNEAAFQSMKCENHKNRLFFATLDPSMAKSAGRQAMLRKDWEAVKEQFMYEIVKAKFTQNRTLKYKLMALEAVFLEEGNYWHDNIWGNCFCERCKNIKGQNKLGKILMIVRDDFLGYEYKEEV